MNGPARVTAAFTPSDTVTSTNASVLGSAMPGAGRIGESAACVATEVHEVPPSTVRYAAAVVAVSDSHSISNSSTVTVVPGVGHFFHGQLSLLKQLVTLAWAHR